MAFQTTSDFDDVGYMVKKHSSRRVFDPYTLALLSFNESVTKDISSYDRSITSSGVTLNTDNKKYGAGSGLWNTGNITFALSSDFALSENFVIEMWLYPTSVAGAPCIFSNATSGSIGGGSFYAYLSSGVLQIGGFGTSSWGETNTSVSFSANSWQHLALVKSDSRLRIAKNGVIGYNQSKNAYYTNNQFRIGYAHNINSYAGYIDDFRISSGTDRGYTVNFTPPDELSPYI